ncbi:putative Ig domain-containing protein [uncultured Draconibacterium sp.]|uniref:putative Ig domain-containing protein n=1 Tax=uncultured Draconibacterium sp. TaxID=1573823 RepID=UPI002AA7418C|nr:putative Ig domain-containing protein [uncultured Draconibacterium sp.]
MKKLVFLTLVVLLINFISFAQTTPRGFAMLGNNPKSIELNQTFTSSGEIFPFRGINANIYGAAVDVEVKFTGSKGVVRLILLDENFNEYQIYETFPLLEEQATISIENICEETTVLEGVKPYSLYIEVKDAEVKLKQIKYATGLRQGFNIKAAKQESKELQLQEKVRRLNAHIKAHGLKWIAGPTDVAKMTYAERKKLYGQSTFPAGIEYYAGGILTVGESISLKSVTASTPYIPDWDWRDRHGKNWITPVTNQGQCGSCWAFAATGATEAMANLYFNDENLDLDLSEQDVLSCTSSLDDCDGGQPYRALDKIRDDGVVDEGAWPYTANFSPSLCTTEKDDASELIKINGRINYGSTDYPQSVEGMQKMLIEMGPISGGILDWSHAMVLVGYHTVKEGDSFTYSDGTTVYDEQSLTISAGDPLIGTVLWIFKNSWGTSFGNQGYSYFEVDPLRFGWTHGITTPITSEMVSRTVHWEDADNDGYYWWGLGEKPADCPGPDLADGDDSDPTLGPLDEYGYCTELAATAYNIYYGHLHNHSNVSDGTGTPDDAYNYAKNTAGLDFFGLSDHANQIDASEWATTKTVAESYNQDGVFTTFWGFEWSHSTQGHVTVINTDDYCTINTNPNFSDLHSWVNTHECAAFFNHPGRQNSTGEEFGQFLDTPSENFVGMELWNKNDLYSTYYYNDGYYTPDGNLGYFDEAQTHDWKIGAGGSEDNHEATWGTYNDCNLAVLANNLTRADIYEAIKNRRFYSTLDKNIKMSFKIDGSEMGSSVEGAVGQGLQIQVSDDDGEIFSEIQLMKNGLLFNSWTPGRSDVTINENMSTSDGDYYYIKVTQPDGDEAISSPIFIEGGISNVSPVCAITNPEDGQHFNLTQSIVLSADASDSDGSVTKVEFFVDGVSVGTDNSSPFEINWTIPENGSYNITAKATDNFEAGTTSNPVNITVGTYTETVSAQIASANDDAEEGQNGTMYMTSTDLELVYDTYNDQFLQTVGLHFSDLNIPQGATITNAWVQFTVDEVSTGTLNLTISGDASDDSPAFTSSANNLSNRIQTANTVSWSPPDWNTVAEANLNQQTPDLSAVIQEIVDRPGFSASSAISLFITGSDSNNRIAESYDGDPSSAAVLNIEYTVGEENEPPIFVSNPLIEIDGTQDAAYNSSLADDATDPEGDPLTFHKISGPDWLTVAANGDLSGTPDYSEIGSNNWTVQVMDDFGNYTETELQIHVINVNDPPEFTASEIIEENAFEDHSYTVDLSNYVSDKDGDTLTYTIDYGPSWLSIDETTGVLSGTPAQSDVGASWWYILVSDGQASDGVQLDIIVEPWNDLPYFYTSPVVKQNATEDLAYSGTLIDDVFDEENDVLVFTKAYGPAWLQISPDGQLSGTPLQSDEGINIWDIEVDDGGGIIVPEQLEIYVDWVNDAPVWNTNPIVEADAMEGVPYSSSLAAYASDEEGDNLFFIFQEGPGWLIVEPNGTISGTPSAADIGLNTWIIRVDDQNGEFSDVTLQINVQDFNYAPEFTNNPFSTTSAYEDSPYSASIAGSATDTDGDALSYSKIDGPDWLTVDTDGTLSGTPVQTDVGQNSFTVEVSDGNGGSDQAILEINVLNVNGDPVFSNDPIILADATEDQSYSASILSFAYDEDGDVLTFTKASGPVWLSINTDGTISGTPSGTDVGINSWTVEVSDNIGTNATTTLQIDVIAQQSIDYCEVTGNVSSEWINNITVNGESLTQITPINGYSDYTNEEPFNLETNTSVSLLLSPGFSGRSTHQYWAVYIDYDQNGFDTNDLVFAPSKSKSAITGNFTTRSNVGITRMRIMMSDSGTPSPCNSIAGGEIEDYLVNIQPAGVNPPIADFTADNTVILEGETVSFTDISLNNPTSWEWDFGNTETSTLQNPTVTYNIEGIYTVALTATNSAGSNTETKVGYITVEPLPTNPPVADFTADVTTVYVNAPVQFTDLSSNAPTEWCWDFGDGQTSDIQNPAVSYAIAGTYSVTSIVSNAYGSDTLILQDYITVNEMPDENYCEPVINNSSDWIVSVDINGQTNTVAQNPSGYMLFTDPMFEFEAGATYSFELVPSDAKSRNFWRIWLDTDGLGTFTDAGETLYTGNNKKGSVSGSITIPSNSVTSTRLRIAMKTGSSPASCDDNFSGEMEDYLANINQPLAKSVSILPAINSSLGENETSLNVYPNPFNHEINIAIKSDDNNVESEVYITDITGRLIFNKTYGKQRTITIMNLQLNPGSYFITVRMDDWVTTKQLTKTR